MKGAGGREWEGGPGRGWDQGERGPGEPCLPPDQGCAAGAPPADARASTGAGEADSLWPLSGRGALPGAGGSAGAGKRRQGCGAGVSSRSALLTRRNAAAFSASRSSAVTRKPSSGGAGSLSGSPRLRGSRGNLRLPGLGRSDVGGPFSQVRFCPLEASASSGRLLLWEATWAAQGGGGPPSLAFLEDLRGSPRGMRGPVLLCPGGKPRVELWELVMAFLWGQELTQEVWSFSVDPSTELLAWRFLRRGPGLGTKAEKSPRAPRGLNVDRSPREPSGPPF